MAALSLRFLLLLTFADFAFLFWVGLLDELAADGEP